MNKENDEFISLFQVTRAIDSRYKVLLELYNKNKEKTDEFSKEIDNLKMALDIENKMYFNISPDKSNRYMQIIFMDRPLVPTSDFESIVDLNAKDKIERRILMNLSNLLLNSEEILNQLSTQEKNGLDYMRQIGIPKEILIKEISTTKYLDLSIMHDIYSTFIMLLNETPNALETVKKTTYEKKKWLTDKLTKAKFDITFIYKELEKEMIFDSFESTSPKYFLSEQVIKKLDMDNIAPEINSNYKNAKVEEIVISQIYKLLEISNAEFGSQDIEFNSILRELYLRSASVFLDDEIQYDIKRQFNKIHRNSNSNSFQNVSEALIDKALNSYTKDKQKIFIRSHF